MKSLVLDKNRIAEVENIESDQSSISIDVKNIPKKGNHLETRETKQRDTRKSTNYQMRDTGKRSTKDQRGTN